MPKIKLKPNVHGVEIGIGNAVKLKLAPGETAEVAAELLNELLASGHFEVAKEEQAKKEESGPKNSEQEEG